MKSVFFQRNKHFGTRGLPLCALEVVQITI